jgi:outer membrane protein assembly factor BamB
MLTRLCRPGLLRVLLAALLAGPAITPAADRPQWGQRYSRNMVSDETGLPDSFDPKTGRNVKWIAPLGTECYSTPVVAGGKVLLGTNNNRPRDPRHQGDRGVMFCLNEADGSLAWQLVVPKLEGDIYLDWPQAGMCSPATVEGDRVYTVTNRDEVVCLDLNGMANGNDGPFRDEARHAVPQDQAPSEGAGLMEPGPLDADILWLLDLRTAAGVRPHDSSHSSILQDGPYLYVNTSNGLNSKHQAVDKPEAPSLVVVDKATGRLVAQEREGISRRIFHSTWSSPALGEVGGRRLVFFGGGDGVVYAFEAFQGSGFRVEGSGGKGARDEGLGVGHTRSSSSPAPGPQPPAPAALRCVWRFDCDPTAPKQNIHSYIRNRRESPSNIKSMPVFHNGRVYVTVGGDIWWGKNQSWLQCIDASKTGDVTQSALLWSYSLGRHCCSTPSVHDGLVYAADCDGKVHCVDAETGRPYWVHDAGGEIWASTLVADGKLYVGTRRGDFWVLAAGKEKRVLSSIRLRDPVISTPVAANGTLYVGTMTRLYALKKGSQTSGAP